ncbi:MAG: PQQ-binding-like beta-propeller repeat protein [Maioricimonas sp. JB049]
MTVRFPQQRWRFLIAMMLTAHPFTTAVSAEAAAPSSADNWAHWRGPEANGISRTATPPVRWSEQQNVQWKVAIDGAGTSTPIVWEDRVFLLTAINTRRVDPTLPKPEDQPDRVFGIKYPNTFYRFEVLCLDRNTGRELWRQTATERVPHEGHHRDNDFASASPTTDGRQLYCWFGSAGLYTYDLEGNLLWSRDLGKAYVGASLGEGCSPVVHGDRLVIVRDHSRQSTIHVLDTQTGETVWEKNRDEPNAWATPRIIQQGSETHVITAASNRIRAYDLNDRELVWECGGLTGNVIPSPVVENGVIYCMSGYQGHALLAVRVNGTGDVTDSAAVAWRKDRGTPYIPSPLLYDGMLYFTQSNQAILSVLDAKTGEAIIERTRLPGLSNIYASPVGAAGRVYFTGRDGTTLVLERTDRLKVLATNQLDDRFDASPALAGKQLFLRGIRHLYCIAGEAG